MQSRSRRLAALALTAALLGGCQDYNFSPVKYCLIQPGTERVTLSDTSTADLLFVVDDSGSMAGKQVKLGQSFAAFVNNLKATNVARVDVQLEPIDFHIAVTTTSVFLNAPTTATCAATCAGSSGAAVCCDSVTSQPIRIPKGCTKDGDCTSGDTCRTDCQGRGGQQTCCAGANAAPERISQTCPTVGQPCGLLQDRYVVPRAAVLCPGGAGCGAGFTCRTDCPGLAGTQACCTATGATQTVATCVLGVGTEGALYPKGDFVKAGANPRVLHFTKDLFCTRTPDGTACACTGPGAPATCDPPVVNDAAIGALSTQFTQNVNVGTCGSGQEQGMEGARRAIQKALHLNGLSQPVDVLTSDWPHEKSKLVVVFVGDEDDCSSPEDPNTGVIFATSGTDACVLDGALPEDQQRRFKTQVYADFLASLNRPLAGAFIVSAKSESCVDDGCQADLCCDTACTGNVNVCSSLTCGGVAPGFRFIDLSTLVKAKGADTVVGSVCANPDFSSALDRVAEVVKQPAGLQLPTQPASEKLTILRIASAGGKTRKTCVGPAPATSPAPTTPAEIAAAVAAAEAAGYDWWFTGGDDTNRAPTTPSRFIFLNRLTRACEANPGETYSADYLGLVPAGGCATDLDCVVALGGDINKPDWNCHGFVAGVTRGTCLCGPAVP